MAVVFAGLTTWSWQKWSDVLVDVGPQLYAPWQISEGRVLYRDLAYFFGPLSPYFNAAAFRTFGVSIRSLACVNLVVLVIVVWLLDRFLGRAAGGRAAVLGTTFFLAVFSFSQYLNTGNYNFVLPVAHEATHGTLLCVALLAWLQAARGARRGWRRWRGAGAGLLFGLIFLTKAEFVLPAAVLLAGYAAFRIHDGWWTLSDAALLAMGMVIPPVAAFLAFAAVMPVREAAAAAAGALTTLLTTPISGNFFWVAGMGLSRPLQNAVETAAVGAIGVGGWLLCGWISRLTSKAWVARAGSATSVPVCFFAAWIGLLAVTIATLYDRLPFEALARGLPVFMIAVLVSLAFRWTSEPTARTEDLILLTLVGATLLLKMALNCRLSHYGFYLAPMAAMALVAYCLGDRTAPCGNDPHGWRRATFTGLLVGVALCYLRLSNEIYSLKDLPIGAGADRVMGFSQLTEHRAIKTMIDQRHDCFPVTGTLMVFPEGVILNYFLRAPSSTRYAGFLGGDAAAFGEQAVVAAMENSPPDMIAFVHRETAEFGFGRFGAHPDYGRQIVNWVTNHYDAWTTIFRPPFTDEGFGAQIYVRSDLAAKLPGPDQRGSVP